MPHLPLQRLLTTSSGIYSHIKPNALFIRSTTTTTLTLSLTLSRPAPPLADTESDDSPGIYLRDDFLGGPTELRAPSAERAALFLDAALAGRLKSSGSSSQSQSNSNSNSSVLESALIFTLHVYQYSLSRKGGGKSFIHSFIHS